ncbi:MAG: hypothetical protein E5V72_01020 [Mesorhizobium sp.]|uniref:hypothetical protein n=1 Tax=Mesorhizobium sp. TaxID=1871066 RepID=UPI000FE935A2|nr:hypothetical protein [Mesorhizobium sp.]RWI74797.1 MAG: hypothetical protein EOR19_20145 [Mesorhizobium sp.]RWJ33290.1 MAG: hypothetical protein EOR28_11940 [Mesorhizobium sp.]TIQ68279.1 MAG: hypothetical protein E5X40_30150 [Mesorhizobium sp.]TIW50900.1 MAG: hypothetical protein E5V72_01020 [Mesorhizobium sp.]
MRKLITLAALCAAFISPAGASSQLAPLVEKSYNVHYSGLREFSDGEVWVHVIWYDDHESISSAETICELDPHISTVAWGSLSAYLKHHRDVLLAGTRNVHKCKKGR